MPVKWFPCLDHDPKKHREIFINSNPLPFVTLDEIQRWRLGLQNEMEVDLSLLFRLSLFLQRYNYILVR